MDLQYFVARRCPIMESDLAQDFRIDVRTGQASGNSRHLSHRWRWIYRICPRIPKLLDAGFRVRILDMCLFGEDPLNEVKDHKHLELIKEDFRKVDEVVQAMHGAYAVVHLGAIVGDPACSLDEALTIDVNLASTKVIADCAKQSGVTPVYFCQYVLRLWRLRRHS